MMHSVTTTEKTEDDLLDSFINLPDNQPPIANEEGRVFTAFFCGTCSNSEDYQNKRYFDGENVSSTHQITKGNEYIDKLIVDGPGSGENDLHKLWAPYHGGLPYSDTEGISLGAGIEERIEHFLAVLKNMPGNRLQEQADILTEKIQRLPQNADPKEREKLEKKLAETQAGLSAHKTLKKDKSIKPIKRVNIVAWSRGAAAAIEAANRMKDSKDPHINSIEVNLILLDPVPGIGLSKEANRKIPDNVKNVYCMYATDERSACFSPIFPDVPTGCNFYTTFLPGGHAQVAGDETDHSGKSVDGADLKGVGKICRAIIHQALHLLGTEFNETDEAKVSKLTLEELATLYKTCKDNAKHYAIAAQRVPYIYSQLLGNERKVIHGNDTWFNQYFNDVRADRQFGNYDPQYLDHTHQALVIAVAKGKEIAQSLVKYIAQLKSGTATTSKDDAPNKIKALLANINNDNLLCRAISEEFQKMLKPNDLKNLNYRCNTKAELQIYIEKVAIEMIPTIEKQKEEVKPQPIEDEESKNMKADAEKQIKQAMLEYETERKQQREMEQRAKAEEEKRQQNSTETKEPVIPIPKEEKHQQETDEAKEREKQEQLARLRAELHEVQEANQREEKERPKREEEERRRAIEDQKLFENKLNEDTGWRQSEAKHLGIRFVTVSPPITSISKPSNKGKIRGGIIGALVGTAAGAVPASLIIAGIILLPFTFGGSAALIGVGAGLIVAGAYIGGSIGVGIGAKIDAKEQKQQQVPAKLSNETVTIDESTHGFVAERMDENKKLEQAKSLDTIVTIDEFDESFVNQNTDEIPSEPTTSSPLLHNEGITDAFSSESNVKLSGAPHSTLHGTSELKEEKENLLDQHPTQKSKDDHNP